MQAGPRSSAASEPRSQFSLSDDVRGGLSWKVWAFPGILVFLLSIPCIGMAYLWDDYYFLNNAMRLRLWDFIPDIRDAFYRPLSRGVYFSILSAARDSGALLGHWINVLLLSLTACLVGAAGARLGGKRVGICSGVLFAGLACAPTLVAWTSCSQDLLAMLLVMSALHCRMSGLKAAALVCFALGVLSKETAIVTLPAIMLVDQLDGRRITWPWREVVPYTIFLAAWASLHPAVKILVARGFQPGGSDYVGLAGFGESLKHAGMYLMEFCNLRVGALDVTWTPWEIAVLVASVIGAVAAIWQVFGSADRAAGSSRQPLRVGVLLSVGPWLLTSVMIIGWWQYYAAFSGLGTSLILGSWLADKPRRVVTALVAPFLILGLWGRASETKARYLTESDFRVSSDAYKKLRASLFKIQPTLPAGTQLLMSVQARGRARVYFPIYFYNIPSIWYRDPTITVRKPEERTAVNAPEYLFAVTQDLDVVRIDPFTFEVASASGQTPDYLTVEQALRTYAMGLAGSGETDAAARLLVEMPEIDRNFESLHHRMAVMFLLADGREEDARKLSAGIPAATRTWALDNLPAVLAQQPPNRLFDNVGLRAFGFDSTDVDALRHLTNWYLRRRYPDPAGRFAERLLARAPGDSAGIAAIAVRDSVIAARAKVRPRED